MRVKRKNISAAILLLGVLFMIPQNLYGQNAGFKYFRNYTPEEYDGHPLNWCILQDKRGIIYVGNQGGVLEFDGVSWRKIKVPNMTVRSLAIDDTGTIYVGGRNEIGYLAPDSKGELVYQSLLDYIDKDKKYISNVQKILVEKDTIYFCNFRIHFRWNARQKKMEEPLKADIAGYSRAFFICDGKLFARENKFGLMQLEGDELKLIKGGDLFAAKAIYMMVPYDPTAKKLLIGTRSNGLYIYDVVEGITPAPFPDEVQNYIKENMLSHGRQLSSGDFALATLRGGLIIIDYRGRKKHMFNKDSGLQNENVKHVFEDAQGNLWLGLNVGISKIEYNSPISVYDDRSDLTGYIVSVTRHGPNNDLYVGTSSRLYYLASSDSISAPGKFRPVPDIDGVRFSIISIADSLLVATWNGVYQVETKKSINRIVIEDLSYEDLFFLLKSKKDSNRIWVGMRHGLLSLYLNKETGNWAEEHCFAKIFGRIDGIVEDKKGNLWLETFSLARGRGVSKLDFPGKGTINKYVVTRYDTSNGLPTKEVGAFLAADHVLFSTEKGLFRFDEKNKVFIPDFTLGDEYAGGEKGKQVFHIVEDKNKNIWFNSNRRIHQAISQPDGSFVIHSKPFLRLPPSWMLEIYPEDDGNTIWFATKRDGLIRYDTKIKKKCDFDFPVIIRKVATHGKLIFGGYKTNLVKALNPKAFFLVLLTKTGTSVLNSPRLSLRMNQQHSINISWKDMTGIGLIGLRKPIKTIPISIPPSILSGCEQKIFTTI